ncbi:MAG: DNA-binding protein [Chitinophagaceae bacterium]|nr:MAG: DNA-binding protein [Chitinophagaceae bacterium]
MRRLPLGIVNLIGISLLISNQMEKLTLESLPQAVERIIDILSELQTLIEGMRRSEAVKETTLTIKDACNYLGLARATVYSKVSRGEIPAFKIGKKLMFELEALQAYQTENRAETNYYWRKQADEKIDGLFGQKKRTL